MTRDVLTENEEVSKAFRIVRFDEPKQNELKWRRQALSVEKSKGKRVCKKDVRITYFS